MRMSLLLASTTFVVMVIVNYLGGSTELIGGATTAEISAKYSSLITPRGYVFSIWLLIYLSLAFFLLAAWRGAEVSDRALSLLAASNVLNALWVIAWNSEQILISLILAVALAVALGLVYMEQDPKARGLRSWAAMVMPFSIYFAWASVAVAQNITAYLVSIGWSGGASPETWASIVTILLTAILVTAGLSRRDPAFPAVLAWAAFGIRAPRDAVLFGLTLTGARIIALIALIISLLLLLVRLSREKG